MTASKPPTIAHRVKELEGFAVRQGELLQGLLTDVQEIKTVLREQEIKDVREEAAWAKVSEQLALFNTRLSKIEGLGNKGLGIFAVALIGAFVTFIIKGGLA